MTSQLLRLMAAHDVALMAYDAREDGYEGQRHDRTRA